MRGAVVLCFGEVLWDRLPTGRFPGGAPVNVAYHLTRCGVPALPVTAVGDDPDGRALLQRLGAWGLELGHVAVVSGRATGVAQAELRPDGTARYRFGDDVAWDRIELSPALLRAAGESAAVVYGTLAQRSAHNRARLEELLERGGGDAWAVYDVNLRAPHDDPALVWRLAGRATLIKLNDEELGRLAGAGHRTLEKRARAFADRVRCPRVCVTAGARGAGLLWDGAWHWTAARPVVVRDTVGAGDAFLAGLVRGLAAGTGDPQGALEGACRLGEFVAASDGATPEYRLTGDGVPVRVAAHADDA